MSSSSWKRRALVIGRLYPTGRRRCSWAQLIERSSHLGLHLERFESLADAPLVAGHDQLAHLLDERRVVAGGWTGRLQQPRQLGVDVQRGLSAANQAVAARAQHLADLILALGLSGAQAEREDEIRQ